MKYVLVFLWLSAGDINGDLFVHDNAQQCKDHGDILLSIYGERTLLSVCREIPGEVYINNE